MTAMQRTPALTVSALALTLAFGLTGCGLSSATDSSGSSDSSQEAPALTATPAAGEIVTGDGYSFSLPEGWAPQDASLAPGADSIALDEVAGEAGSFPNNVNVVLSPTGPFTPDDVEETAKDELETTDAIDITLLDRVTVADTETVHFSAGLPSGGATYNLHQYYLSSEESGYVVTFTFDETFEDADAVDIAESILASWTWS
jgi:hypothetical protein